MKEREHDAIFPDARGDSTLYIVGLAPGTDSARDRAFARKIIAAEFERMNSILQIVVLLHFYDSTDEEQIARLLRSSRSMVNKLLLRSLTLFEQAVLAQEAAPSYRDMPQLIFEALDDLIYNSTVPPKSVERVRQLLLEKI